MSRRRSRAFVSSEESISPAICDEDGVERRHEHLVPAVEIHVERALGDAGGRGDARDRRPGHAVLGDDLDDGLHDLPAPLRGR